MKYYCPNLKKRMEKHKLPCVSGKCNAKNCQTGATFKTLKPMKRVDVGASIPPMMPFLMARSITPKEMVSDKVLKLLSENEKVV